MKLDYKFSFFIYHKENSNEDDFFDWHYLEEFQRSNEDNNKLFLYADKWEYDVATWNIVYQKYNEI